MPSFALPRSRKWLYVSLGFVCGVLVMLGCGGGNRTVFANVFHNAVEIAYDNFFSGMLAANVQQGLDEVDFRLDALETNVTTASAVVFDPSVSGLVSLNVQGAIDEVDMRVDALETAETRADVVSFDPAGSGLGSTNVQGAIDEVYTSLEYRIAQLEQRLAGVHRSGDNLYFDDMNVYVRSGSGRTSGPVNGKGNLIVGYNELRGAGDNRTGSHNLILGQQNNYSSFGGAVFGYVNSIESYYATVTGGRLNRATGDYSSVSGGSNNLANGYGASILGGRNVFATGSRATVAGGRRTYATGDYSSVAGGCFTTASGIFSAVGGGLRNLASGRYATVSGGVSLREPDNYGLANPYHP